MKVSFTAVSDSTLVFMLTEVTSHMHDWIRQGDGIPHEGAIYIALSVIVTGMAVELVWRGNALRTGRLNGVMWRRSRAAGHFKRNSLLYLWAGFTTLLAQSALLLGFSTTATVMPLLSIAIAVFAVLVIALLIFPKGNFHQHTC